MRTIVSPLAAVFLLASLGTPAVAGTGFRLSSPTLKAGGRIPASQILDREGCSGGNRSPELRWSGAPAATRSYALTLHDPDAPTGSGWWHWVAFNIPATSTSLPAGLPEDSAGSRIVQSMTDFGKVGYDGPCPPKGDTAHHYVYTLHALRVGSVPLDAKATAAMVGLFLHQNALATTTLTVRYGR
ncbi:YbhB/YbcL family Raf kinase inhibitor-like protein [Sphingosinicellaceae bacterium]|nr:YbhB/YbcL family Raf kinase inhibitor-like protein [Sphingosinicellaceae bacterium]